MDNGSNWLDELLGAVPEYIIAKQVQWSFHMYRYVGLCKLVLGHDAVCLMSFCNENTHIRSSSSLFRHDFASSLHTWRTSRVSQMRSLMWGHQCRCLTNFRTWHSIRDNGYLLWDRAFSNRSAPLHTHNFQVNEHWKIAPVKPHFVRAVC